MAQVTFQPGEEVVRELRPSPLRGVPFLYLFTLGLYEVWRRRSRFILTDRRIIISKGVVNRSVRFLPLDRVQDATLKNQLWLASIQLTSAGGSAGVEQLYGLRTREAREFVHDIASRIGPAASGGLAGSHSNTSVADELQKLTQLRGQGVLTADQFETQKAKLLQ